MTEPGFRYATPTAFRTALKERFGQIARADGSYRLDELQRQFAYDRALARLFSSQEAGNWVLKGAGALLDIDGLVRPSYRVFPIADHLADKLCATLGAYTRDGQPAYSSRVKDLVDIAIVASTQTVHADMLGRAVVSNATIRKIKLPGRFAVPDPAGWATRYPRVAAEAPGPVPDFDDAVRLAGKIFDPILGGTAAGIWNPSVRSWTSQ